MTAMKKEELEQLEEKYGLTPDDLSYQHRCSRIAAVMRGEEWKKPKTKKRKAMPKQKNKDDNDISHHPLYGKRILITPLMTPDAKRNLAFDEDLGAEIEVREFEAGEHIYGEPESVTQMVGDYEIIRRDSTKHVMAKTTFPKIGTEISWCIGKELVPVVRGNSGERGYIWSFPTKVIQVGDTLIQVYGLKTLIQQVFPELIPKFSGKPLMSYIDGITLAANIPMTEALIREQQRKERIDAQAGINY
jgi:hypothetical protein